MNPLKGLLGLRLVTKIFMTTCAGVEANLNGSKCERKLDKNKSTPKEYFIPLVRFDVPSQRNRIF